MTELRQTRRLPDELFPPRARYCTWSPSSICDPTQMTVGMIEVERKRKAWAAKREGAKDATLASHMVPVVLGPGQRTLPHRPSSSHPRAAGGRPDGGLRHHHRRFAQGRARLFLESDELSRLDAPLRPEGPALRLRRNCRKPSRGWRTTPIARSPGRCATSAATPRIRRRSPNSSGPISSAPASSARTSRAISTPR